jgi:hypothetical protein
LSPTGRRIIVRILLILDVQSVQDAMLDRREDQRRGGDDQQTRIDRIEASNQLRTCRREDIDREFTTELS